MFDIEFNRLKSQMLQVRRPRNLQQKQQGAGPAKEEEHAPADKNAEVTMNMESYRHNIQNNAMNKMTIHKEQTQRRREAFVKSGTWEYQGF